MTMLVAELKDEITRIMSRHLPPDTESICLIDPPDHPRWRPRATASSGSGRGENRESNLEVPLDAAAIVRPALIARGATSAL